MSDRLPIHDEDMTEEQAARNVKAAVDAHVRRRGLGSPMKFKCPKCSSPVVHLTGKTRPYKPAEGHALGTRGNLEAREYNCECGHNGWTNHNDAKEPRKMKAARVYFFDNAREQGAKECREHAANNSRLLGFVNQNGNEAGGIVVEIDGEKRTVTRADFDSSGQIRAKIWQPGTEAEWILLSDSGKVAERTTDEEEMHPNVAKFAGEAAIIQARTGIKPEMNAAQAETVRALAVAERAKRIENITAELEKLDVSDDIIAALKKEYEPY